MTLLSYICRMDKESLNELWASMNEVPEMKSGKSSSILDGSIIQFEDGGSDGDGAMARIGDFLLSVAS